MVMDGEKLKSVKDFKYLGSVVNEEATCSQDVQKRIQTGWNTWRELTPVMCDRRMPVKLKGKPYRTVVRPAMLYGAECWATTAADTKALEVAEMKMLRWSTGITMKDKVRSDATRGKMMVRRVGDKLREKRLRWFGHIERRNMDEKHIGQVAQSMKIDGKMKRGRPKTRWMDCVNKDMKAIDVGRQLASDRDKWSQVIKHADPREPGT